jgi:uncharacterized membrane protein
MDVATSSRTSPHPGPRSQSPAAAEPAAGAAPAPEVPDSPTGSPTPARSGALDRLRGIALVAMLVHHIIDWLTGDARAVLPGWRAFALTDAAAVAFFVAAGASAALFVQSRRRRLSRAQVAGQVARRYGMLVPIGVTLDWVFWRSPLMVGVLEVLGVTVLAGVAVSGLVPRRMLPVAAVTVLAAGIWSETAVAGSDAWFDDEVIGGKFPLVTYLGFVLLGIAAVRTGWWADRRRVDAAAVVALLATLGLLADGIVPARYPGSVPFVVPGLALTIVAYALAQRRWSGPFSGVDAVIRGAAAHTLGIFVGHYLVYGALRGQGALGAVDGLVAVPAAVGITVAACLVAPRVPQLPWSLRTGRRRRRAAPAPARVARRQ